MIKKILKETFKELLEDWSETDHKLLKIITGVVSFLIAAFFWFYFFRNTSPFGF